MGMAGKRSYCYSSDTARATVDALISDNTNGQTINIGNSNQPISLEELAKLVIKTCSRKILSQFFKRIFPIQTEKGRELKDFAIPQSKKTY